MQWEQASIDRDSPGPTLDEGWRDKKLEELGMGATAQEVENYFHARIFPGGEPGDSLKRSDRQPMAKHTTPNTGSGFKVSTPVPDMLYGYQEEAFARQQQTQLISVGTEMMANDQALIYPFFVIEFQGEGPCGPANLWVATNQCPGGSASCINTVENFNRRLRQCKSLICPIDSAAFSIAMNGTEARLYISWKQSEVDYYTANVQNFLLQNPEQYLKFRKYVHNIIDWGRGGRLEGFASPLIAF
ncbi:hypothetical protein F53441_6629 [Fusarium austroafricanum]|uniref:DUF7924 domain-containing protein n=1 Tax=Fusarium austroafricanum TaxID=2364996 RepID=A0A8H4NWC1_9HYPO|nr:hypothetical protein F53441_6629 [Fusarium austroafricanum]